MMTVLSQFLQDVVDSLWEFAARPLRWLIRMRES